MKKILLFFICVSTFVANTYNYSFAEVSDNLTASQIKEIEKIRADLYSIVDNFLVLSSKNIIPSKANPKIEELPNGKIRVSYVDFDRNSIELDVYPSTNKNAKYFAKIYYVEFLYKSERARGTRFSEDSFTVESARKIMEITRYSNGKWDYSK